MSVGSEVVITNADWEVATHAASPYLEEIARLAGKKWDTTHLRKADDTQSRYREAFRPGKTLLHGGCGHGGPGVYTGYQNSPILDATHDKPEELEEKVKGAIHYLLSCLTARKLGPAIIEHGGKAYIGWYDTYKLAIKSTGNDPYVDPYVRATVYPGLIGLYELVNGKTVAEAEQAIRAKMEEEYERWKDRNVLIASIIRHNLSGLRVLGDKSARVTPPSPPPPPTPPPSPPEKEIPFEINATITVKGTIRVGSGVWELEV